MTNQSIVFENIENYVYIRE